MESLLQHDDSADRAGTLCHDSSYFGRKLSGAAGYLIFMNGNYAGQTTDTTVTLTNTDEGNIYTVKTVCQYGTVSE